MVKDYDSFVTGFTAGFEKSIIDYISSEKFMIDVTKQNQDERTEQIQSLVNKADNLNVFGTLTSLVSTAAYFIEQKIGKNLPSWLSNATLGAIGVGVIASVSSLYMKLKAGRMAIGMHKETPNSSTSIVEKTVVNEQPTINVVEERPQAANKNWVGDQIARQNNLSTQPERY